MTKVRYFLSLVLALTVSLVVNNNNNADNLGSAVSAWRSSNSNNNHNKTSTADETVHVLFGLSGDHVDFMAEFEVALKSVLLNAPLDRGLSVHVLTDLKAHTYLDQQVFPRTQVAQWRSRTPISIVTYLLTSETLREWNHVVRKHFVKARRPGTPKPLRPSYGTHTFGSWFRLFAHKVLPLPQQQQVNGPSSSSSSRGGGVREIIYMDTDVVILSNLNDLWKHVRASDPNCLYHWGPSQCAGFVVLNVPQIDEIWNYSLETDLLQLAAAHKWPRSDQLLLRAVNRSHPQRICLVPPAWDLSIASGLWRLQGGQRLAERHPAVGMLHFNGGGKSQENYFTNPLVADKRNQQAFGIVNYYIHLPWTWARHMAASQIPEGATGFRLELRHELYRDDQNHTS